MTSNKETLIIHSDAISDLINESGISTIDSVSDESIYNQLESDDSTFETVVVGVKLARITGLTKKIFCGFEEDQNVLHFFVADNEQEVIDKIQKHIDSEKSEEE